MSWLQRRALALYSNPVARAAAQAVRRARRSVTTRRLRGFRRLTSFEERIMSEFGEDGAIREIFFRIGHSKRLVEFGASDGSESNAALLTQYYGWGGLLIEGDPELAERLRSRFTGRDDIVVLNEMVTRENIVELFRRGSVPSEFDLLSIDIDGNDYWVWGALSEYRPRVVIIEYNATIEPDRFWTVAYDPQRHWRRDRNFGASLAALTHQGHRLGYALIGTLRGGRNALFVRRDLLARVSFDELTPREAFQRATDFVRLLPEPEGPAVTSADEADRIEAALSS